MAEPVIISVQSEYISNTPDLQMRLWLRNLIKQYLEINRELTPLEIIQILNDEANRVSRQYPVTTAAKNSPDTNSEQVENA